MVDAWVCLWYWCLSTATRGTHDFTTIFLSLVISKKPFGMISSKLKLSHTTISSLDFLPFFSSAGGLFTAHRNLSSLLSNPLAISFTYSLENDPQLPKHRNTTLLLGCWSNHDKQSCLWVGTSSPASIINGSI